MMPAWRTSSFSNGKDCVQLARLDGDVVGVRDSKHGEESPVLGFSRAEVRAFIAGAKAGEFDDLT